MSYVNHVNGNFGNFSVPRTSHTDGEVRANPMAGGIAERISGAVTIASMCLSSFGSHAATAPPPLERLC